MDEEFCACGDEIGWADGHCDFVVLWASTMGRSLFA